MDWDQLEVDAYAMLNLTPHELYEFTHREYTNMIKGYQVKYENELKKEQWNAWWIANYVGMSFNKVVIPDEQLTEEQKYNKARNKWISIHKHGIEVPQSILDQYNIK